MNAQPNHTTTRREAMKMGLLAGAGALGASLGFVPALRAAQPSTRPAGAAMLIREIPKTGEKIPVVGLGTNRFGVQTEEEMAPLRDVIRLLVENGGSVIDTARGYGRGRAEEVIGKIVADLGVGDKVFIATKTSLRDDDRAAAVEQLEASLAALGMEKVAAMRVHNLGGWQTLLPVLHEWKQEGKIRYLGVSTSSDRQYEELARLIEEQELDIVEVDYSVTNRSAAERILPLCQEHGVAVLNNVPLGGRRGSVLGAVGDRPLPDFAAELGATSWAQLCLKYNLSHPAVTAVIPGTTNPRHIVDNVSAGRGELPDEDLRRRIEAIFDELE